METEGGFIGKWVLKRVGGYDPEKGRETIDPTLEPCEVEGCDRPRFYRKGKVFPVCSTHALARIHAALADEGDEDPEDDHGWSPAAEAMGKAE